MARQCPRCELRFVTAVQVRDHLISDHGMTPEQLAQPYPLPGGSGSRRRGSREEDSPGGKGSPGGDSPGGDGPAGRSR